MLAYGLYQRFSFVCCAGYRCVFSRRRSLRSLLLVDAYLGNLKPDLVVSTLCTYTLVL